MRSYEFVKSGLLPGSLGLLMILLVAAVVALESRRAQRLGRALLITVTVFYLFMGLPRGAQLLGTVVSAGFPVAEASALKGINAIVVLDGGQIRYKRDGIEIATMTATSSQRALETLRVHRLLGSATIVVSAGAYGPQKSPPEGAAIRSALIANGIRPTDVVLDSTSRSTAEHATNVPVLLRRRGITRFALVTSAVHMRRAMRAFARMGVRPVAAPAPLQDPAQPPWWPSVDALRVSYEAVYELIGITTQRVTR
jgi:uncharacterized SAM-binding protein YcdF (DUF218 family)